MSIVLEEREEMAALSGVPSSMVPTVPPTDNFWMVWNSIGHLPSRQLSGRISLAPIAPKEKRGNHHASRYA